MDFPSIVKASDQDPEFAGPAIIDLMGHVRVAGLVREVQIAGAGFLRIDIPAVGLGVSSLDAPDQPIGSPGLIIPAQTIYQSPASIYSIQPVTEAVMNRLASTFRREPASAWDFEDADLKRKTRVLIDTDPPPVTVPRKFYGPDPDRDPADDDRDDPDDPGF